MNIKIGVLIPHSKTYPRLGKDYINGLKLGLKSSSTSSTFSVEGIGLGADKKVIIDKAQKLTNQDDVQVLTGLLGHVGIEELHNYAKNMEVVLLYSDMGATLPKGLKKNPWVFCNSFELYKSAMLFGQKAANWGYKNIAISTSYYDAGYEFSQALGESLYESGGAFAGHFITPLYPRENESELMASFVQDVKPDAIYAVHSGIYATEHATYIAENKITKKIPFFTTAFGLDTDMLVQNESFFEDTKCISPWFIEEENEANKKFIKGYKNLYDKLPSAFAMLGYENGLLLKKAVKNIEGDNLKPKQLRKKLGKVKIGGPRGRLFFNPEINRTSFPQFLWKLVKHDNSFIKQKEEKLDFDLEIIKSILNKTSNQTGGWHNAYLCD